MDIIVMVTYSYAYMTYIVSPLAGLGGHIVAAAHLQLVSFEITCILYIIFIVLLTVKSSLHYAIETVNYTYLVT